MKLIKFVTPAFALVIAVLASIAMVMAAGESPKIFFEAIYNTWFTSFGLGYTLFYTTPLIFTGLSVAVAFHCGLFNIGAEGQLYIGSLGAVLAAYLFPNCPPLFTLPLVLLFILLFAGSYGAMVGALKAYRGSHEVIVTILLNFIAYFLVDYFILYIFRNPETQNPETFVTNSNFHLTALTADTPLTTAFFIALATAGLVYLLLFKTTFGFELRTVGHNPRASKFAGIPVERNMVIAFLISGFLAGMVALNEVTGNQHRLIQGFSPQYGFTGIAVAMLARNNPIGLIFSAFLFGSFHNASRELEFASDKISKELSFVIQGVLIAIVASEPLLKRLLNRIRYRKERHA